MAAGTIAPTLPTLGEPRGDGETDVRNSLSTIVTGVNDNYAEALAYLGLPRTLKVVEMRGLGGTISSTFLVPLDPLTLSGKTSKLRLRIAYGVNTVAPARTVTATLAPVTAVAGASSSDPAYTAGAATLTYTTGTLLSSTFDDDVSGEVNAPTAGLYLLSVTSSGVLATGSRIDFVVHLELRHV